MISNSDLTIYHKSIDLATRLESWTRFNYFDIWLFGRQGAGIDKGYDNANGVEIRIPLTESIDISNFSIGDIIVQGSLSIDINTQQDLKGYKTYNITTIKNNNFGSQPHIHLSGE